MKLEVVFAVKNNERWKIVKNMFKKCQKHIALHAKVRTNIFKDVGDLHWIGSTATVATVRTSESEDFLDSENDPDASMWLLSSTTGLFHVSV